MGFERVYSMKKTVVTLVAAFAAASALAVQVSKVFSSNMVLQRDRPVPVWGLAEPGEAISVDFAGQSLKTVADAKGEWSVTLKPMKVSREGRDMVVAGSTSNVFANVLVGDVWLCSGQSNMEMSFSWGIYDGDKFKAESVNFPEIRHMKIRRVTKFAPEPFDVPVESAWNTVSNVFQGVTAAGYFFARKIVQETGVPVGLLNDSWSGCRIEPFISPDGFRDDAELAVYKEMLDRVDPATELGRKTLSDIVAETRKWADEAEASIAAGKAPMAQPPRLPDLNGITGQYNWMIHPLTRFPIKGAIWYQGCSNAGDGLAYTAKMRGLINGWRKAWGYDFPFYFVQLASFQGATQDPAGGNGYAPIREGQRRALQVPGTGMAVAIDVGNGGDIHPKAKLFVGERLAAWALAKDYGKNVVPSGPLFKSLELVPAGLDSDLAAIRVKFDYVGSGLMAGKKDFGNNDPVVEDAEAGGKLKGFAIRGADGKWHWATAVIEGGSVLVSSPDAPEPDAVRYAYSGNPMGNCNLYNREGLPASPFDAELPE